MGLRDKMAEWLAPGRMNADQVTALVTAEVARARQAMPISRDYDPRNEGYRRLTTNEEQTRKDMSPVAQDVMITLAYYLYDTSGLVKRFVRDTKNFVLGEGVSFSVGNDTEDGAAMQCLDDFWYDPTNRMDMRLDKRIEFFGLLGEQCWPAYVNPRNGRVWLSYVDPANIDEVFTVRGYPEIAAAVKLRGTGGRPGTMMPVVRAEEDMMRREFGKLVGECFFFSCNNPPNDPRGRSDMVHLFDFVNGFEEGLFDELDRLKLIKAFVWDVTLKGADDGAISEFLRKNRAPKAGSIRAHNEQVEWNAVAPDLKSSDNKGLFDMMRTYLSACMNRPDSWMGSGGKAYQTEAELMGEPTFKDLGSRQRYVKYMIEDVLDFALDQAVLAGALPPAKDRNGRYSATVHMPEMSPKNLKGTVDSMSALAQALTLAEANGWVTPETSARIFASVAEGVGVEIDPDAELEAVRNQAAEKALRTPDYQ